MAGLLAVQQLAGKQQQLSSLPPLRFAVLCSGYRSALPAHRALLDAAAVAGGVALPSLHLCGAPAAGPGKGDRQISPDESLALADCFAPAQV